ncbi:MAG: peptidoglycan bridge formation glycyltransferase FemA/FemB family protein [Thermomicrobiales bacterium]|nr:peptidoglycan bridge formation glycyltransferase FemA/FemB family protein [Thermomicrobiales bacterium]
MSATAPTQLNEQTWDALLEQHDGHLLQSWLWGEFKRRHGWQPERVYVETPHGLGFAQILFRSRGPISVGYCPRGPLMTGDANAVWPILRDEIDKVARRRRAMSVIFEPDRDPGLAGTLASHGIKPGPEHNQPARTVVVPLEPDEIILGHMHQKTRYSVRLAMRRGVEVSVADTHDQEAISAFYNLLSDTAGRNEFAVHSREYYEDFLDVFGDRAHIAFAHWEGNLCASVIAARFGKMGVYMYGASSTVHRGHGAAFLLQFEAMKWARENGCTCYDLWGIPKDDPESFTSEEGTSIAGTKGDDWRGIYRFKTGFGGQKVCLPDTFEREYIPGLPWLARKLGVIQE